MFTFLLAGVAALFSPYSAFFSEPPGPSGSGLVTPVGVVPAEIRVRIFPHLEPFPPQGKDADPTTVTLKSPSACGIYKASPTAAEGSPVLVSSPASLDLTLTREALADALWIQCTSPVSVVRAGASRSYNYSGSIYAHAVDSGPELIEVGPLDGYVRGVVPAEMPAEWNLEALKAQAVAARTFALFQVVNTRETSRLAFFDLDDTVWFQAYGGNVYRDPRTDQAVEATSGEILMEQGQVIQAYFSSDAGGYTEDASQVWPVTASFAAAKPEPFPQSAVDAFAATTAGAGQGGGWTKTISFMEMSEELAAAGLISGSGGESINGVSIPDADRDRSGRAKWVDLSFSSGAEARVAGLDFERVLRLESSLVLSVDAPSNGTITLHGRGFGHGAGMGQVGAQILASPDYGFGWDYAKILGFYYTGVELQRP